MSKFIFILTIVACIINLKFLCTFFCGPWLAALDQFIKVRNGNRYSTQVYLADVRREKANVKRAHIKLCCYIGFQILLFISIVLQWTN